MIIRTPTYEGPDRRKCDTWIIVTADYEGPNRRKLGPISVEELAAMWRVTERTIRDWTRDEPALPCNKANSNDNAAILFDDEEVRRWAQENGKFVPMPDGRKKFKRNRRPRRSWRH